MSNDIRSILERLTVLEGQITPTTVDHGLNKQQKSVPQLPALFKPKKISPVLGAKKDPKHPMAGYMVGADESKQIRKNSLEEAMADIEEDMLSKVKHDLNVYLDRLEDKIADRGDLKDKKPYHIDKIAKKDDRDRALINKAVDAVERGEAEEDVNENDYDITNPEFDHDIEDKVDTAAVSAQQPIKTVAMEDSVVFEIHGDDEHGYRIQRGIKSLPTKFPSIDHAQMAIDIFKGRKKNQDQDQDYVEER
jgi:hypothetical protein